MRQQNDCVILLAFRRQWIYIIADIYKILGTVCSKQKRYATFEMDKILDLFELSKLSNY